MLISISVGIGLKQIKEGNESINDEQFIFQSAVILNDVLEILRTSPELEQVESATDMSNFLLGSEVIPFENNGIQVIIKLSSARSKINPNALKETLAFEAFKTFLIKRGVNAVYAHLLLDSIGGLKEDQTYTTNIFNQDPTLFRDYIASQKHLQAINDMYTNTYHESSLKYLDTQNFLYPSKDTNTSIDLNFATASTFEILLDCDELRAQTLSLDESVYETLEGLQLSEEEKINISKFKTSFFEAYLDVNIEIIHKDKSSKIRFEYNIKSKKGSQFVFEV